MAKEHYATQREQDQDVRFDSRSENNDFDNLLAAEAVVDWLARLEREQDLRAAAG